MRPNKKTRRRVYLLGAGMSKEVGAPLVNDFIEELLSCVPKSRTTLIRSLLVQYGHNANIEKILSEIDYNIFKGGTLAGYNVPSLRRIRKELINGIYDTLSNVQYNFLKSHYNYKRSEDPYYYWKRDFKIVDKVERKMPDAPFDEKVKEAMYERLNLQPSRSLGDMGRIEYATEIERLFSCNPSDKGAARLTCAALAVGRQRFYEWLCNLCPIYLYKGCPSLNMKARDRFENLKTKCFETLLHILDDPVFRNVKTLESSSIDMLRKTLVDWRDGATSSNYEFEQLFYQEFRARIYPIIIQHDEWVISQASYLLKGLGRKINPYVLLAGLLKEQDIIITPNYDLFAEIGIDILHNNIVDYGINDLIAITPWGEHGHPFSPLDTISGHKSFTVLKLHGSINWLKCPHCCKIYCMIGTPASSAAGIYIFRDLIKYYRNQYKDNPCCYMFTIPDVEIPIVPPTRIKSVSQGTSPEVWGRACLEISMADELIVIGYSLGSTDYNVRQLIKDSLKHRRSDKSDLIVRVVNPSLKTHETYKKFLSSIDRVKLTQPIDCNASEYLRDRFLSNPL